MPSISRREVVRKFKALGFEGPFSGGRHQFMVKDQLKIRVPNPHGSGDISGGLLSEILRQAGVSRTEWDNA